MSLKYVKSQYDLFMVVPTRASIVHSSDNVFVPPTIAALGWNSNCVSIGLWP